MRLLTLITLAALVTAFSAVVSAKEPTVIARIEMVDVKGGTRFVSNPNFKCPYIGFRLAE